MKGGKKIQTINLFSLLKSFAHHHLDREKKTETTRLNFNITRNGKPIKGIYLKSKISALRPGEPYLKTSPHHYSLEKII